MMCCTNLLHYFYRNVTLQNIQASGICAMAGDFPTQLKGFGSWQAILNCPQTQAGHFCGLNGSRLSLIIVIRKKVFNVECTNAACPWMPHVCTFVSSRTNKNCLPSLVQEQLDYGNTVNNLSPTKKIGKKWVCLRAENRQLSLYKSNQSMNCPP